MAQSALTVTPPNPTPPTNMSCTGATPPNPPNLTKNTYDDWRLDTDFDTYPPPYFDDGTAGTLTAFAANTAALASGTGATAGGTEGSYPGAANGAVPASTSVAHEGAGSEVVVTQTYRAGETPPAPVGALQWVASVGPVATQATRDAGPNATHASSMTPTTFPALSSLTPTTAASGTGTQLITCTGTNFTPGCRIWVDNVERTTTFTSATSIATTVPKKNNAGPWAVKVGLGGGFTAPQTFTWT